MPAEERRLNREIRSIYSFYNPQSSVVPPNTFLASGGASRARRAEGRRQLWGCPWCSGWMTNPFKATAPTAGAKHKARISWVMQPLAMTDVAQAEQAPGDVWTGSDCHQQLQPWGQSTGYFSPAPDNTQSDSCWGEQLETVCVPLQV